MTATPSLSLGQSGNKGAGAGGGGVVQQTASAPLPTSPKEYDDRILWIKSKLESGLYLEFEAASNKNDPDLFTDCLERDERNNLQDLVNFMEDTGATRSSCILFWTEILTKKIEITESSEENSDSSDQAVEASPVGGVHNNNSTSATVDPTPPPSDVNQHQQPQPENGASADQTAAATDSNPAASSATTTTTTDATETDASAFGGAVLQSTEGEIQANGVSSI